MPNKGSRDYDSFYVYIILNPEKPGTFRYGDMTFNFEPVWVGAANSGNSKRIKDSYRDITGKLIRPDRTTYANCAHVLYENLGKLDSFITETRIITTIGRRFDGSGPLENRSTGGYPATGVPCSEYSKQRAREAVTLRPSCSFVVPMTPEYHQKLSLGQKRRILRDGGTTGAPNVRVATPETLSRLALEVSQSVN